MADHTAALSASAAKVGVPTAAEIADRTPEQMTSSRLPGQLGSPDGAQVMVSRAQLSAALRGAHPTAPVMRSEHGWWYYRLPLVGLEVQGEGFDELAARAVSALRARVADLDASGESGDPIVWLVLSSTDAELRTWLGIPD